MAKMITSELFGVTPEVARAMKDTLTHNEYLKVGIALMSRKQVEKVDEYSSANFKYRAKAIKNYEEWLVEK